MLFLEFDQKRTDAVLDKVLGWIVTRWSNERDISIEQSYREIYSAKLYEELMDYDNKLYMTDPLQLYKMFQSELFSNYKNNPINS